MKILRILDVGDKIIQFVMWLIGQKKTNNEPLKPIEKEEKR